MNLLPMQTIGRWSIRNDIFNSKKKKHRCNGILSLHVLNIIEAIHLSAKSNKKHKISVLCEKPKPFSYKEIKSILK